MESYANKTCQGRWMSEDYKPGLVSVCLCTYKRPTLLAKCLQSLLDQNINRCFEVVLVDNDADKIAAEVAETFAKRFSNSGSKLQYDVEPQQNIALARNKAVAMASGQYIAFIDDDEEAEKDWLEKLCGTLEREGADGVFGPVIRVFPKTFPECLVKSNLFREPRMRRTGSRIAGLEGRTGNILVKRAVLTKRKGPFEKHLRRTGGSDTELFYWLEKQGSQFCWCNEAVVREHIDNNRATLTWHFRRGYRSGWLMAMIATHTMGRTLGSVYTLFHVFLGFVKSIVLFFLNLRCPTVAILMFGGKIGGQLGQCGFLLGIRIEEYKG